MTENALVLSGSVNAVAVYRQDGGAREIVNKIKEEARSLVLDASTEAGRKEIASAAYKIARSKTALDDMGKELVEADKARIKLVDGARKYIRDELDALKDEIRKPLTDFENAEKERIAAHEAAISDISAKAQMISDQWQTCPVDGMAFIVPERDWQEFAARAKSAISAAEEKIKEAVEKRAKYDAEQAEFARLRAAEEERQRKEREDQIAAAAAAKAKAEAQAEADRQARLAEQARLDAERQKEAAEKALKEANERAAAAAAKEREKIAAEEKRKFDEQAKREADTQHKAKINNEILTVLTGIDGVSEAIARQIVISIASGKIPHTKISY